MYSCVNVKDDIILLYMHVHFWSLPIRHLHADQLFHSTALLHTAFSICWMLFLVSTGIPQPQTSLRQSKLSIPSQVKPGVGSRAGFVLQEFSIHAYMYLL